MFWIPRGLTAESLLASELFFLITEYSMEWRFRTRGWRMVLIAGEMFLFFDGDGGKGSGRIGVGVDLRIFLHRMTDRPSWQVSQY